MTTKSIKILAITALAALLALALSACGQKDKSEFGIDSTSSSSCVATATNGASGTALNQIEVGNIEEILIDSDISKGSIEVTISDNYGIKLFSEKLTGTRTAQIEPTKGNTVFTIAAIASDATGTVSISTVLPESGAQQPDNTNTSSDNTNRGTLISGTPTSTDQLYSKYEDHATFYVFGIDNKALSASDFEPVDVADVKDGHFYKVVGDVEYLNGGVAGYVNHPEVKKVYSVKEVDPLADMDISPLSGEHYYGLTSIGDYAEGDILLFEYVKGVWKDGKWIYRYHDKIDLDDGRVALISDKKSVSKESVQAGADKGILSCEAYFVMPLKTKK